MRRSLVLLSTVSAVLAMPQRGETTEGLIPPLARVTWCLGLASPSEGCGQATAGRTEWNNDWCNRTARLRNGELSLSESLRGAVLDIVLVPDEDETLWTGSSFGGLVGDVLNELAGKGGFSWNAIVVRPPQTGDVYGGSWNAWMEDWVNRADLVAAWMYDSAARRENGIAFPYSFYELSPVLIVADLGAADKAWWQGDLMAFLQPFSTELWILIAVFILVVGGVERLVEGHLAHVDEEVTHSPRLMTPSSAVKYNDDQHPNTANGASSRAPRLPSVMAWIHAQRPLSVVRGVVLGAYLAGLSCCEGGGLYSYCDSKSFPGRLLMLVWDFTCMILIASYTANLAQSLLLANANKVQLSAESFDDLQNRRATACTRSGTAVTAVVEELLPSEQILKVGGDGGLRAQQGAAAQHIRDGSCAGFVQPLWMAEDMLATEPNAACDLRVTYPTIEAGQGGYITASEWFRKQTLSANVASAFGAQPNITSLAGGAACTAMVNDAIGALLKNSKSLRRFRTAQIQRLRTNQCGLHGAPIGGALSSAMGSQLTPRHFIGLIFILAATILIALLLSPQCRRAINRLTATCIAALHSCCILRSSRRVKPEGSPASLQKGTIAQAIVTAILQSERKDSHARETIRHYHDRDMKDFAMRTHQQHTDLRKATQQLKVRVDAQTRMLEEILSKLGGTSHVVQRKYAIRLQNAVRGFLARKSKAGRLQHQAIQRMSILTGSF